MFLCALIEELMQMNYFIDISWGPFAYLWIFFESMDFAPIGLFFNSNQNGPGYETFGCPSSCSSFNSFGTTFWIQRLVASIVTKKLFEKWSNWDVKPVSLCENWRISDFCYWFISIRPLFWFKCWFEFKLSFNWHSLQFLLFSETMSFQLILCFYLH